MKQKKKISKLEEIERENCKDKTSSIILLKEQYNKDNYDEKKFPYYEYFYYTDYPDTNYISDILEHMDKNEYPLLVKYLESRKHSKKGNDNYSLDNLVIFNQVINLFNDKYSQQITREYAEKKIIKEHEIYQNNNLLFDDFIKIFNDFGIKNKETKIVLDANKNSLSDFVLDDNNIYGKYYKKIYKKFIDKQNNKLEELLNIKYHEGTFNSNCMNRINIQKIKEDEIFTDELWKEVNFIEMVFNSSYRKVIDTQKYDNYNQFEIFLDSIETEMTNSILKNKKLLNDKLIEFKYKDEVFSNNIDDLLTTFEEKYNTIDLINEDKKIIYENIMIYQGDHDKYKNIIDNFVALIEYLIKIKNEENNTINEETIIYEIIININNKINNFKKYFIEIFKDQNNLTVKKISNIYDYYLKLIFKYIKQDIGKYYEKNNEDKTKKLKKEEVQKQNYNLDAKIIKKLDEFFSNENNLIITKESLTFAIRLFISVVLYREEDKENKIKHNKKNIVEYLKEKDLWKNINIQDKKFIENLEKIKCLNIKVNEILWLYFYLTNNKDEEFDKDIKVYISNKNNINSVVPQDEVNKVESDNESEKSGLDLSINNSKSISQSSSPSKSQKNSDTESENSYSSRKRRRRRRKH